ncbi:ABC transporter ATP-binding protein [Herbaspirillum sp.]|uniref:ABC transporter ATP-binding protein n=1 Tax=Herbaspirillum sp. TaxID=1890675 RepID=UPI0031D91B99
MSASNLILDVVGLSCSFDTPAGVVKAVSDLHLQLHRGETLAIVGESGCGKSVTSFSLMRLLGDAARISGQAHLSTGEGTAIDLLSLSDEEMAGVRGKHLGMIFQEPMTSLNPLVRIGDQIGEAMRVHQNVSRAQAGARAIDLMRQVGMSDPALRERQYPHQLSGGMRQRVMIAMALACRPQVLIADEPTTALDVTIQAQILRLLRQLQREVGMGVLFITHDMGVVAQIADRVAVMYGGQLVETGSTATLFSRAGHPYTRGLLASIPHPRQGGRLRGIAGQVELVLGEPPGCRFANRCERAAALCHTHTPPAVTLGQAHVVRCHFADQPGF